MSLSCREGYGVYVIHLAAIRLLSRPREKRSSASPPPQTQNAIASFLCPSPLLVKLFNAECWRVVMPSWEIANRSRNRAAGNRPAGLKQAFGLQQACGGVSSGQWVERRLSCEPTVEAGQDIQRKLVMSDVVAQAVKWIVWWSLVPKLFAQLGHFRLRFEMRSLTQLWQNTWPHVFKTVFRMFALQTGQMATFCCLH